MLSPFLKPLVRKNLQNFTPYSSARDEFSGTNHSEDFSFLDANENPFQNEGKNRYPSSTHFELREYISEVKTIQFSSQILPEQIALGNGSDEIIDILVRIFCEPKKDSICISSPTFGMYKVSADINEIQVLDIPLLEEKNFELDEKKILKEAKNAKILFLCHPNNPTGNTISEEKILTLLENFSGIIVVDEAYIDFVSEESTLKFLKKFPKLVILHTFSKMWGLAGVRCGVAIAHPEIITMILAVKTPYNVNVLTAEAVKKALIQKEKIYQQRDALISEKFFLENELQKISSVQKVFPSKCNSLLVKFFDANAVYKFLLEHNIVVRNVSTKKFLKNCLRISLGTPEENKNLLTILKRKE